MTHDFADDITVETDHSRRVLTVAVTEKIDEEELHTQAELLAAESGADLEEMKRSLVQRAITDALRAEAPEAYDPEKPTQVALQTEYDVQI